MTDFVRFPAHLADRRSYGLDRAAVFGLVKQKLTCRGSHDVEWFREAFDEHYLTVYATRDQAEAKRQVAFLLSRLALQDGARILDLGCGAGRHAAEFAAHGFQVFCLDLSLPLLKMAGNRRAKLPRLRADMRHIPFRQCFDAVVSLFTSFGYFDDPVEDALVLSEVARVLRPGGRFVLDLPNPIHLRNALVPFSEDRRSRHTLRQWRWFNPETRRVEKQIAITNGKATKRLRESVRCYHYGEIQRLLRRTGFVVEHVWGDFDGQACGQRSPRIITLATKR